MCKTQTTRTQLFNMFGGRCAYCGHQLNMKSMTKDHLLAKADGGDNTIENLLPACRECNQGKGHSSLEGWRVDFFLPTLSEDEKSTREKMFAAIAAKKFYFERVAEDQIKKSMQQKNTAKHSKSHKKEEDKDFTLLTDERLEKMESDSGYRAMMKVLGLLSIAHQELHNSIKRYQTWNWVDSVYDIEEEYQMVLAMSDNVGRVRNLFLDIVETRYGTRNIKSLEKLGIDKFPDEEIVNEIDKLEDSYQKQTINTR